MATIPGSYEDIYGKLTGAQRDVATAVTALFKQYGLDSLSSKIVQFVQQGFSADTISVMLQETPEYQKRFAANQTRIKKGLPALSPAEYISVENSYRQIMSQAGLPVGFYDSTTDFQKFLENDLAPTELQQRVTLASEAVYNADAGTKDFFSQWYSTGDMIAYALDPGRAAPIIERNIRASEAAATARAQGVGIGQNVAEQIGRTGVTLDALRQGFGAIGQEAPTARKLGEIYGSQYTDEDLASEVFLDNAQAAQKRRTLSSRERAAFSGSSGAGGSAFTKDRGQS